MTKPNFFILILTIIGISGLQWFIVPSPDPVSPVRLAEDPWKIPDNPEFNAKESLATLTNASLWGKLADTALAAPLNDPEWRFLGALSRGQESQVIIQIDGQPEQRLVPGDSLPGGSQILSIDNDRLCLLVNGQKRSLAIYSQGPLSGIMPQREREESTQGKTIKRAQKRNQ
jgi:hypothetical protein